MPGEARERATARMGAGVEFAGLAVARGAAYVVGRTGIVRTPPTRRTFPRMQAADSAPESTRSPLSRVRHDLLTPLNGIIGYAGILLEDAEDAGEAQMLAPLDEIRRAAQGVARDIRATLDPGLAPGALDAARAALSAGAAPRADGMVDAAERLLSDAPETDPVFARDLRQLAASARELAALLRAAPSPPAG
ncbi:MAG: hypothetical protein JWM27_2831 [Gemmatimonadetes bacterium]|nr:hypothetical protein [Gemmatimonadota bacterium]